jgi:hypothetical protein
MEAELAQAMAKAGIIAKIGPHKDALGLLPQSESPANQKSQDSGKISDENELQLDDLLKLLDQKLISEMQFDEDFLESLPDGIYSYRGKRAAARVLIAVQLLILLQQQNLLNQPAINFQQMAALRQLQMMQGDLRQILRLPPELQAQKLREILQSPQLRQAIGEVKQNLQSTGQLPQGLSIQKLALSAAITIVRGADPALQKLAFDLRRRLDQGQLSPRALHTVQHLLHNTEHALQGQRQILPFFPPKQAVAQPIDPAPRMVTPLAAMDTPKNMAVEAAQPAAPAPMVSVLSPQIDSIKPQVALNVFSDTKIVEKSLMPSLPP